MRFTAAPGEAGVVNKRPTWAMTLMNQMEMIMGWNVHSTYGQSKCDLSPWVKQNVVGAPRDNGRLLLACLGVPLRPIGSRAIGRRWRPSSSTHETIKSNNNNALSCCLFVCCIIIQAAAKSWLASDWKRIRRRNEIDDEKWAAVVKLAYLFDVVCLRRSGILFTNSLASPLVVVVVSNLACLVKLEVTDPKRKGKRLCR
jgi:hypothetical protein